MIIGIWDMDIYEHPVNGPRLVEILNMDDRAALVRILGTKLTGYAKKFEIKELKEIQNDSLVRLVEDDEDQSRRPS